LKHAVVHLFEALRLKPNCRWFVSRWSHTSFTFSMGLVSTQPVTEMSTRNFYWPVPRGDNLTSFTCRLSCNPRS